YDADGNYDCKLYAMSLQCPGVIYTQGEFPAATNSKFRSLYKHGDLVYCLSSFNRNIYSMDENGTTRIALMCGGVYNALNFTKDKAMLIPNTLVTSNPNEIRQYNAKALSSRTLYGDAIGLSCYYTGAYFTPDDGQAVYSTTDSVSTVSKLPITVTECFTKGADLVVRTKYTNSTGSDIKLRSYIISVAVNGQVIATDVNRMPGFELRNYGIQTFTFVIGADDINRSIDLSKDKISIQIIPTYDIIPEQTKTGK
ncbi:MAG TPA: hypothetical protein DIT84_04300, partial [Clostridiales bacterium]|nr:hypothetical protein [Clostridiales bacterium]